DAIMTRKDTLAEYRVFYLPRLMMLLSDSNPDGWATSFSAGVWFPTWVGLRPYAAAGLIYGVEGEDDGQGHRTLYRGSGTIWNLGDAWNVYASLDLHSEFAYSLIYNTYDHNWSWTLVPEISASIKF